MRCYEVAIRDARLSEKMQTDPALTLKKTKTMIRQRAAMKEQRQELEAADSTLEGVSRETHRRRTNWQGSQVAPQRNYNVL